MDLAASFHKDFQLEGTVTVISIPQRLNVVEITLEIPNEMYDEVCVNFNCKFENSTLITLQ